MKAEQEKQADAASIPEKKNICYIAEDNFPLS